MGMVIQEAKKYNLTHTDMLFTLIQLLAGGGYETFTVELVETIKNGRRAITNHSA